MGIYSGSVVYFVGGYLLAFLLIVAVLAFVLLPLLPLLIVSSRRDLRARLASILLVPPYFILLSEMIGRIALLAPVGFLSALANDAEDLLPLIVVSAMIVVLNFFIIEADLRKRQSAA